MLAFAFDGITSLSVKPIRLITGLGFFISLASFIGIIWVLLTKLFGVTVSGWASMACAIFFMGGVQLLCLGVIGEYIGKIYNETKARPQMCIRDSIQAVGGQGALRRHLLDMGLTPGTTVMVRKIAPMGDPIELHLRGYELTLRLDDAKEITLCGEADA